MPTRSAFQTASLRIGFLTLPCVLACASRASDDTQSTMAPPQDASGSQVSPPENNPITLTLFPFWEVPVDENGFGQPEHLDGVEVCVIRRRGHGESWEKFVDVDPPPCTTTVAGENVVLSQVPAMSELLVTAEKEGYVPRAIPVTTGQWDQNAAIGPDLNVMHLFSREAFGRFLPNADPNRGVLVLVPLFLEYFWPPTQNVLVTVVTLGGVSATLEPMAGEGPLFFYGGVLLPDAVATVAGTVSSALDQLSGLTFTNLPEEEYAVELSANAPATAFVQGSGTVFGYPDRREEGVIRAPVLEGHYAMVVSDTRCDPWSATEARTCAASQLDGGSLDVDAP